VVNIINEVAEAYHNDSDKEIRQLIEKWEADLNRHTGYKEIEAEDWRVLVPVPGHTCDRIKQFKHTLFLYWSMKGIMGKALEQISLNMVVAMHTFSDYKREFHKIMFHLQK